MKINIFFAIRIAVGLLFIISGVEKLISSYQNFFYVVQSYEVLSMPLAKITAFIMPWIELFLGVFLVIGLYLKWTLYGVISVLITFIFIVSQAIIRSLPIDECGCFGGLVSLPLHGVLMMDITLLFLTGLLLFRLSRASFLSLDNDFNKE